MKSTKRTIKKIPDDDVIEKIRSMYVGKWFSEQKVSIGVIYKWKVLKISWVKSKIGDKLVITSNYFPEGKWIAKTVFILERYFNIINKNIIFTCTTGKQFTTNIPEAISVKNIITEVLKDQVLEKIKKQYQGKQFSEKNDRTKETFRWKVLNIEWIKSGKNKILTIYTDYYPQNKWWLNTVDRLNYYFNIPDRNIEFICVTGDHKKVRSKI